jgi:hypothetical protein
VYQLVRTALQPHSKFIIGGGALQDIGNDFHGIVKPDLGMDKKGDIQEVRWWISIQLSIYWMESHVTALTLVRPIRKISARLNLHALHPYYCIAGQLSICINSYLL